MARKLGRPRAGEEPLTRERILATALRLVDERGVEALSMRRLAAELGVDPMAIYHYLPSKAAVLASLVELVFAELQVTTAEGAGWQDRVRAFARAYRDLVRAHPHLVLHLVSGADTWPAAVLEANERLYAALAAAGLSPRKIVPVADLVVDFLNGFALAEAAWRIRQPGEQQGLLAHLDQRPPGSFSTMRRVFDSLAEDEPPDSFEAGLDIILAGIEATAGESTGR